MNFFFFEIVFSLIIFDQINNEFIYALEVMLIGMWFTKLENQGQYRNNDIDIHFQGC